MCIKDGMVAIREAKSFHFNFDLSENGDNNLKREVELTVKRNESLAECKIDNEIYQLLYQYVHENDIYEHIK